MRTSKNISLQVLRGLACLLVVLSHCPVDSVFSTSWGGVGVSIFVVLSGVVVTMGKDTEMLINRYKPVPFAVKRIKTIWPPHFLIFLFQFVISILRKNMWSLGNIILTVTMTKAFIPMQEYYYGNMGHTWYLTLVWFFALLTPFLLKITHKVKTRPWIVVGAVMIVRTIWIIVWTGHEMEQWMTYICPVFRALDYFLGLMLGVYLKRIGEYLLKKKHIGITLSVGTEIVLMGYLVAMSIGYLPKYHSVLIMPLTISLIICFYTANYYEGILSKFFFKNTLFVFWGNISFEVYLLHMLAYKVATAICARVSISYYLIITVAALLFVTGGAYLYQIFYRKALNLLRRLADH